jgi:hypothetical protein
MKIQLQIFTEQNVFSGDILEVNDIQYKQIIEMSKNFYDSGFEMNTDDGGFVIIPPELVKKAILKINIVE